MKPSLKANSTLGSRRSSSRLLLIAALAFAMSLGVAATTQAANGIVSSFRFPTELCINSSGNKAPCEPQKKLGAFVVPSTVEVNSTGTGGASPGDIYLGESNWIQQLSSSGDPIRAWGPEAVASGPGNVSETQAVRVEATGGSFRLGFGGNTTGDIVVSSSADQVQVALEGLSSIGPGGVSVSGGPGDAGGSTPYMISFDGSLAGIDQPLLKATSGSPPLSGGTASVSVYATVEGDKGLEVCEPSRGDECALRRISNGARLALDEPTGRLYSTLNGAVQTFSATGAHLRSFGQDVVAAGPGDTTGSDEEQSLTVKASGGAFTLSYSSTFTQSPPTTAPIPYNALAETVESALNALSSIGGSYGSVTVTGGPGNATGSSPYQIVFHGTLAGDDLPEIQPTGTGLVGAEKSVVIATLANGGGYEICEAEDACKGAAPGETGGALDFALSGSPAVAPVGAPNAGNILVTNYTNLRVQEFSPAGDFVRAFGWDVDATTPSTGFEVCTAVSGDVCKKGTSGDGIGQFGLLNRGTLRSVTVDSDGAIYTAEASNLSGDANVASAGTRVQKFTPGPGLDLTPSLFGTNESQEITVNANAGTYRLAYGAEGADFFGPGGTKGLGDFTAGSAVITDVKVSTGTFVVGKPFSIGNGFPVQYIVAIDSGAKTITMSQPATFSRNDIALTADRPYITTNLSHNASAAEVQAALNALPSVSQSGSVSVSGSSPYTITFDGGRLARTDPPQIEIFAGSVPLTGGSGLGANTASVATTVPGGPGGVDGRTSPYDIAAGPGNKLTVAKFFPAAYTSCVEGQPGPPNPAETRLQQLDSNGSVLETSDPCSGIRGYSEFGGDPSLIVNDLTGRPYLLSANPSFFVADPVRVHVFGPPGPAPEVELDPVSKITSTGGTISGTLDPNGPGTSYPDVSGTPSSYRTTYRVEFKKASESEWTKYSPDIPIGSGFDPTAFSVSVGGLAPKTPYELKLVAVKSFTATVEEIVDFTTLGAPPQIEAVSSKNVTIDSADLHALINPQGTETSYHFEYGTTPAYGNSTPETSIGDSLSAQPVVEHIEGLEDTTYHFRVVATNELGTTTSQNQTFDFHPPVCPNQTVRQQTGAAYLPDCRAYELVSPEEAGGTTLFTGGPQSPYASNPPRLAFVGQLGEIPGAGKTPINSTGDLYLSTRGASGWKTRYIGPAADEAGCVGGRPLVSGTGPASTIQNDVMADSSLGRIINWNLGNPLECYSGWNASVRLSDLNTAARGSNAPYVWNAQGDFLDRWPTQAGDVAGAKGNFDCPQDPSIYPYPPGYNSNIPVSYFCSTYVSASKDLSHFVFSTQSGLFGQGGGTAAPGSAYDNHTGSDTLTLVSKLPNGDPIPQEPGGKVGPEELIQFPAVSVDGSHILMGTATEPLCKQVDYPGGPVQDELCPIVSQPTHLYMRVDQAVTYDVSAGKAVKYVGSTSDGTKVYFTSEEQITGGDDDESTDLFLWEENGGAPQLTRVSVGDPAPTGNTDACVSTWAEDCEVQTYDDTAISSVRGNLGGLGTWTQRSSNPGYTDNSIAAESGDIFFYSPEQLVPGEGAPGKVNFYLSRAGDLQHVATLEDAPYCVQTLSSQPPICSNGMVGNTCATTPDRTTCTNGAVGRIQVTPSGRYAAFITTSRITAYDNQGFAQMYRYDSEAEKLECVSCRADGEPPMGDVRGSQGGRFITDDGRVFFDTPEPLEPRDTNAGVGPEGEIEGIDVYEFVDGRAQLITSGTGTGGSSTGLASDSRPGLYGVSADGVDVYFGTFDTLVGQDRNGAQLKFYDARTNGGFPFVPLPIPCQAADECHGGSSQAPVPLANGTGAALGAGGNASAGKAAKEQRKAKAKKKAKRKAARKAKRQRAKRNARTGGGDR